MTRITRINRTKAYRKAMEGMGLGEDDMKSVEADIASAPERHPMVRGLGVRKARIALPGRGKSGGGRVVYFVHLGSVLVMLFAYPKNVQEDLTPSQRRSLLAVIEALKGEI